MNLILTSIDSIKISVNVAYFSFNRPKCDFAPQCKDRVMSLKNKIFIFIHGNTLKMIFCGAANTRISQKHSQLCKALSLIPSTPPKINFWHNFTEI